MSRLRLALHRIRVREPRTACQALLRRALGLIYYACRAAQPHIACGEISFVEGEGEGDSSGGEAGS